MQKLTKEMENKKKMYKIIIVGNEEKNSNSLSTFFKQFNCQIENFTNPYVAIERIKKEKFDLLLLDYMTTPITGDVVIDEIRKFNNDLYIILITDKKTSMPSKEMISKFSIQAYCDKEEIEGLTLLIEFAFKSIDQMKIIKEMNNELKSSKEKLEKAYLEAIEILRYTVEAKDSYTRGHSDRVAAYSVLIGQELGLYNKDLNILNIGGMFHDIGKIGISDRILSKKGKLTDAEYNEIKKHPSIGKQMLLNSTIFSDIIPIVYSHHEKYDGTGYPEGLKGDEIPFLARIVAVADSFDAMTSRRPYRDELSIDEVKETIKQNGGTQFDPEVSNALLNILENKFDKIEEIKIKFLG